MTDKKDCMTMEQAEQIPGIGKAADKISVLNCTPG